MSGRPERRLLSLHRPVAQDRESRHRALWSELSQLVTPTGAHAWRFVSANDQGLHLEFLEFEAANDPRENSAARAVLARLDEEVAPATVEEWLEGR
jgi:hypothetical protein